MSTVMAEKVASVCLRVGARRLLNWRKSGGFWVTRPNVFQKVDVTQVRSHPRVNQLIR